MKKSIIMRKIFYVITALLILNAGCNQKPKESKEKENAESELNTIQDFREYIEYSMNVS